MINKQDYECPICLLLIVQPVTLQNCTHHFCYPCIRTLNNFYLEGFKCPICRTQHQGDLIINKPLQLQISKLFPQEFQSRTNCLKAIPPQIDNLKVALKLTYGNKYQFLNTQSVNKHHWTIYVALTVIENTQQKLLPNPSKLIFNVQFELDETFDQQFVKINQPPYELSRRGWDTFAIPIIVKFRAKYHMPDCEMIHELVFNPQGSQNSSLIYVNVDKLPKIAS